MTSIQDQAEISFKAGFIEGQSDKGYNEAILRAVIEARRAGIKEVVEWVNTHSHCGSAGGDSICIARWELEAKLREWGIEEAKHG